MKSEDTHGVEAMAGRPTLFTEQEVEAIVRLRIAQREQCVGPFAGFAPVAGVLPTLPHPALDRANAGERESDHG